MNRILLKQRRDRIEFYHRLKDQDPFAVFIHSSEVSTDDIGNFLYKNNVPVAAIKYSAQNDSFGFLVHFDLFFPGIEDVLFVEMISKFKSHFKIIQGADTWELIKNRDFEFSVFKNSVQIAAFEKPAVSDFGNEVLILTLKNEADWLMTSCLFLSAHLARLFVPKSSEGGRIVFIAHTGKFCSPIYNKDWNNLK